MNCLAAALAALKLVGIVLLTIPPVHESQEHGRGLYTNINGVANIYVRDAKDCYAVTHELIHHRQYEVVGRMPANPSERYLAETEASRLTQYAMANVDDNGDKE